MRKTVEISVREPQYSVTTNIAFAQVDAWYGHTRRDLKMDIIYPEDSERKYPCIVWICGGAWLTMDKSGHLAYLAQLARAGFAVASVEYRTSNEAKYPTQLQDVKAAVRYLKAHAGRYNIDADRFGVMGESAGGYLSAMAALAEDGTFDVGEYLDYSSKVQAACAWYPVTNALGFEYESAEEAAGMPESMFFGKNVVRHREESYRNSPVYFVNRDAPPFLIIHGTADMTVPFSQGEELHDRLEKAGCDVSLLAIKGAGHADVRFFQREIWDEIIAFFTKKLGAGEA